MADTVTATDPAARIAELEQQLAEANRKLGTANRGTPGLTLDVHTLEKGHDGPFQYWEKDHTSLVHVLWACRHEGLNLHDDADEIATRIRRSRWLTAQRDDAINTGEGARR
ncbi:hypothetical protein [Agromyces humi]|uniref:hypothetical protein n=1 Tax=Agromyces humi TaxID=1766800 RepID=UPI001939F6CB|nr:hypothetical protein [Agromyces humi]